MSYHDIHRKCIADHKQYLTSYIDTYKKQLRKSYKKGVKRQREVKEVLKDVAIYYPHVFSYLLNYKDSDYCRDDLCKEIANMSGGGSAEARAVLDDIEKLFHSGADLKDPDDIKKEIEKVTQSLEEIKTKLSNETYKIDDIMDPNLVLNNLQSVMQILDTAKNKYAVGTNIYVPVEEIDEDLYPDKLTKDDVLTTEALLLGYHNVINYMFELQEDNLPIFPAFFKEILKIMTEADNEAGLKKIIDKIPNDDKYDVVKNSIKLIIDNVSHYEDFNEFREGEYKNILERLFIVIPDDNANLDSMQKLIDEQKKVIEEERGRLADKTTELNALNDNIKKHIKKLDKFIYAVEEDTGLEIKPFAKIKSNLVPKIRDIMFIVKEYVRHNNDHDSSYDKIKKIEDIYNSTTLYNEPKIPGKNPGEEATDMPIDHVDDIYDSYFQFVYKRAEKMTNSNDFTTMPKFIKDYGIKDLVQKYMERFGPGDSKSLAYFVEEYNNTMHNNKQVIDDLNIFMANRYKEILIKYFGTFDDGSKDDYTDEFKDLRGNNPHSLDHNLQKSFINRLHLREKTDYSFRLARILLTTEKTPQAAVEEFNNEYNFGQYGKDMLNDVMKKIQDRIKEIYNSTDSVADILNNNINTSDSAKTFVHNYNQIVHGLDRASLYFVGLPEYITLVPYQLFDGIYTEILTNKIFASGNYSHEKRILFGEIVKDAYFKDNSENYLYNPDFKKIHEVMIAGGGKNDSKRDNQIIYGQYGGNGKTGIINSINATLLLAARDTENYHKVITKYRKLSDEYKKKYNDIYAHIRFLILIATNQYFGENYNIYKYINKGIVIFYKRIVEKIIEALDDGNDDVHVMYMNKHFNATIRRLHKFLTQLSEYMVNASDVIDIRSIDHTSSEIRNNFILLNYFKSMIESYKEMFQNLVTIYARLNDIRGDISFTEKVFVSDHEYVKHEGCGYDHMDDDGKCSPKDTSGSTMAGNEHVMWTRNEKCENMNSTDVEPTLFTEVYDTVNFPENSDISKYMTLETQLSKKKGICIMTYGYSGTGKTYTLFGTKSKQGMLQSTLMNVNGLEKVGFRLFEIHGYGLPYYFYWMNNDGSSRMNEVDHNIYHHKLDKSPEKISLKGDPDVIDPQDFLAYTMNTLGDDKYISIDRTMIEKIFKNFTEFTEAVDDKRKKAERIRETPNNPESSRSILVYDFKLYVGGTAEENAVKFLILDLPGREEIAQTYIDPYLGADVNPNNPIQRVLALGQNAVDINVMVGGNSKNLSVIPNIERLRMIITCMAINPMALSVFKGEKILDFFNTYPDDVVKRDILYGINNISSILDEKVSEDTRAPEPNRKLGFLTEINDKDLTIDLAQKIGSFKFREEINKTRLNAIGGYHAIEQFKGLISIFIIYRLLKQAKIKVLGELYKQIIDEEINDKLSSTIRSNIKQDNENFLADLATVGFKGGKAAELKNDYDNGKVPDLEETLIKWTKYDYLLTPLEGIYINENIIGLIRFLAKTLLKGSGKSSIEVLTEKVKQKKMEPDDQRNIARTWLMSFELVDGDKEEAKSSEIGKDFLINKLGIKDYEDSVLKDYTKTDDDGSIKNLSTKKEDKVYYPIYKLNSNKTDIEIDIIQLVKQQRDMVYNYVSDKIFNYDKPLITDILRPYIEHEENSKILNETAIKDYKIFYLFANYDNFEKRKFKCHHQINLLKNTLNFIEAVAT